MLQDNQTKPMFSPPLYIQRYLRTVKIIEEVGKGSFSKVIDIGCSELNLFQYLKKLDGIKELVLMDIDYDTLKRCRHKVDPLPYDSVFKREQQLYVTVLCGDARFPHYPTKSADVVTMIEFIEHLYEDDLGFVVQNVFGWISPKLVIITTPNYDYNRFFPDFTEGNFRHFDHKFEWTRKEFEKWCIKITKLFCCYEVTFSGCGGSDPEIFCSQIGIFSKRSDDESSVLEASCGINLKIQADEIESGKTYSSVIEGKHCPGCLYGESCNIIHTVTFPFDSRTSEEKITDRIKGCVGSLHLYLNRFLRSWELWQEELEDQYCSFYMPWLDKGKSQEDPSIYLGAHDCEGDSESIKGVSYLKGGETNKDDLCISHSDCPGIESQTNQNIQFKFKLIQNERFLKGFTEEDMKDIFFYSEEEEKYFFTVATFRSWAELDVKQDKIKETLESMNIKMVDLNDGTLIKSYFGRNDSDSEEESEDVKSTESSF